jgi:hypothetical protein
MKIGRIEGAQEDKRYDDCYEESSCCKKNKPTHEEEKCEENNGNSKEKIVRIKRCNGEVPEMNDN